MSPHDARRLEGTGSPERLAALQRRFRGAARRGAGRAASTLLLVYWAACLGVIGVGLDRLYPHVRQEAAETLGSLDAARPFPNCAAAHLAGVYNIPSSSPAYRTRQDGDGDGWACEPLPDGALR